MKNRIIALPIETIVRELDAKILLSAFLLNEGFDVLIGSRGGIFTELKYLKNVDIIYKSISKDIKDQLLSVKANGGNVYILDEEANVFSKNEDNIIKSIFPENMIRYIDDYFICGEKIKKLILKNITGIKEEQLHVVGHPRFDFFKTPYKNYFRIQTHKIKEKYKEFVLFNLNFSMGNPYRGWDAQVNYLTNHPDFNESIINDAKRKMEWQKGHVIDFIKIIKGVAEKYPDNNIIVRPHPSEDEKLYEIKFKQFPNIFVRKEGNVLNWIHASEISVHYDCTTAIETILSSKPTISYTPNRDETLVNWLAPFVSDEVHTEEDFYKILDVYLNKEKEWVLSEEKSKTLNEYIANLTLDSAKGIARIMKNINPTVPSFTKNVWKRFFSRKRKYFGKIKRSFWKEDEYTHHFKDLRKNDLEMGISELLNILDMNFHVEIKKHGLDTYLIKRKG